MGNNDEAFDINVASFLTGTNIKTDCFHMDSNSVSPMPPLAIMENEKTPPGTPNGDMPPPPDEK